MLQNNEFHIQSILVCDMAYWLDAYENSMYRTKGSRTNNKKFGRSGAGARTTKPELFWDHEFQMPEITFQLHSLVHIPECPSIQMSLNSNV